MSSELGMRIARNMQALGTWAGGTTRAIYAYPPGLGLTPATAQFWVGTAAIQQAAAYSFFSDRTRIHIPIHGNGIRLHFQAPAEVVALDTFDQHRFDGARPVQVELVDGPVVAFNLIAQTDCIMQAHVISVDGETAVSAFPGRLPPVHTADDISVVRVVYVAAGAVALQKTAGHEVARLEPDDAFVIHPRPILDDLGAPVELCCLAARADVVVATIVFRASA